jgi:RNA polymerase sigma-70 factor (ECF subfamily)
LVCESLIAVDRREATIRADARRLFGESFVRPPRVLRARLAVQRGRGLVLEIEVAEPLEWYAKDVKVIWEDGSELAAAIVGEGTARPGDIAAGQVVRLVLLLKEDGPSQAPVRVEMKSRGETLHTSPEPLPAMPRGRSGAPVSRERVSVAADLDGLLPAIAAGDASAFARRLAGREGRLRASLRPFAATVDTEAVLPEALLRVWQVANRVVPDSKPEVLLRLGIRIARNLAVSELRRNRLDPVETEALDGLARDFEQDPPGPGRTADPALRQAIEGCRRQLPARPAAALTARLENAGEEPDARLAERLGMRINTFLQNIGRARRLLADCLKRRGIDLAMEMS